MSITLVLMGVCWGVAAASVRMATASSIKFEVVLRAIPRWNKDTVPGGSGNWRAVPQPAVVFIWLTFDPKTVIFHGLEASGLVVFGTWTARNTEGSILP